jgi:hypothetical protein
LGAKGECLGAKKEIFGVTVCIGGKPPFCCRLNPTPSLYLLLFPIGLKVPPFFINFYFLVFLSHLFYDGF